ncbi:MAG: UPF0158 family protein [Thermodesulfobacteriota bacterium]
MKKLKVDFEEIAMFMENQDRYSNQYYFDKETGETLIIPDELMRALEEGESCEDLPKWELELVPQAKEIFKGSSRYEEIPIRPSYEGYNLMVEFVEGLTEKKIQRELFIALDGKGAFRRFKNVIRDYPEVERQWYQFKREKDKEMVKDWLESLSIELIE